MTSCWAVHTVAHIGPPSVRASLDAAPLDILGTPSTLSRGATVAAVRLNFATSPEVLR